MKVTNELVYCILPKCGKPATVRRIFPGISFFPILQVYLCSTCKDISLWNQDFIKEEKVLQKSAELA